MRYFVIAMLALIVLSLGSALYYLVKDRGQSMRTVKALALRVGLSITLFLILMASYYFGFITDRIR
ncbi:MAG: twin transmembrane helix small protein [Burkholderiales bacterium]|jgi:formate/nitrite transporter FocA (FNT family)